MGEMFDRVVRDTMAKFGWRRSQAEKVAKRVEAAVEASKAKVDAKAAKKASRAARKKQKRMSEIPPLKLVKTARTAKERVDRALGPDDGPKRGGSPFMQGGSPGLGKRR